MKRLPRVPRRVPVLGVLFGMIGATIVLLGLIDAFLTILHPDRDGRLSAGLNRGIWRVAVTLSKLRPAKRNETLGFAGPLMVVGDVLLWMLLPILGYGVMYWQSLSTGFNAPVQLGRDLWDAIYFSGVTFTTLGFGDITPRTTPWEMLSIAEAITGFLVMSTSIAYIVAVFEGVDQRDALALKIYSETGGTWNGALFVSRALEDEGLEKLRGRVEGWATMVRELHGRLYRFHGLALYLRTHGLDLGPERMLYALLDVTFRCQVLARAPEMKVLRPAADHLSLGVEHFASALVRRHGTMRSRALMEDPVPSGADAAFVREAWAAAAAQFALGRPSVDPAGDERLLALACRLRVFLAELDRLTLWRTMDATAAGRPAP